MPSVQLVVDRLNSYPREVCTPFARHDGRCRQFISVPCFDTNKECLHHWVARWTTASRPRTNVNNACFQPAPVVLVLQQGKKNSCKIEEIPQMLNATRGYTIWSSPPKALVPGWQRTLKTPYSPHGHALAWYLFSRCGRVCTLVIPRARSYPYHNGQTPSRTYRLCRWRDLKNNPPHSETPFVP